MKYIVLIPRGTGQLPPDKYPLDNYPLDNYAPDNYPLPPPGQ